MAFKIQGRVAATLVAVSFASAGAHAFPFLIPIPMDRKPATLNSLIEALEKSDATKAIAYTHEDKLTGSKRWVWGYYTGPVSQQEANTIAMSRCENALTDVKTRQVDGRLLFKFGSKTCELHQFSKDEASTSGQR